MNPQKLPSTPMLMLKAGVALARKPKPENYEALEVEYHSQSFDPSQIEKYNAFHDCADSRLHLNFFYLLAQQAQLHYMSGKHFPFKPTGMIHVANRLDCLAPWDVQADYSMEVGSALSARAGSQSPRVYFRTRFYQNNQQVVECLSEYAFKLKQPLDVEFKADPAYVLTAPRDAGKVSAKLIDRWELAGTLGRQYAAISKDYNPIHLSGLSARLFGFDQPIMHGMYLASRCAFAVEHLTGRTLQHQNVHFLKAVPLPSRLRFVCDHEMVQFYLLDERRNVAYVRGSFAPEAASKTPHN